MTDGENMTVDHPDWPTIRNGAFEIASARLQTRYDGIRNGIDGFRDQADTLVKEVFTKPPGSMNIAGALFDIAMIAVSFCIPEEALMAALIVEAVNSAREMSKIDFEAYEEMHKEFVANSIEEAVTHCTALTKDTAEKTAVAALQAKSAAVEKLNQALDEYITAHPTPLQATDQDYKALSDGLGFQEESAQAIEDELVNKIFPPFRFEVERITAQRHFFHDLDPQERFPFLIQSVAEQGTDPLAFLSLIGADHTEYDPYLEIYRNEGAASALSHWEQHDLGAGSEAP
ncbi:MAG TPA: hypothetical protein VG435_14085 [Acidimicrobiales bacterium]|jgi:hypothetical protein|nr:hypothetical protein [Acidimicrobiales bacterium]